MPLTNFHLLFFTAFSQQPVELETLRQNPSRSPSKVPTSKFSSVRPVKSTTKPSVPRPIYNYCGVDGRAAGDCHKPCPFGQSSECAQGESCWAGIIQCPTTNREQKVVVVVGDSITQGNKCSDIYYPTILQERLGTLKYNVINAGVNGMTMMKKGQCSPTNTNICSYWNTDKYVTVMNTTSDIVTIMMGTNDAKFQNWGGVQQNTGDFFALDFVEFILNLKKLPSHPKIFLVIPPIKYDYPTNVRFGMNSTIINDILPVVYRNLAAVLDIDSSQIVDIPAAYKNSGFTAEELSCDGVHPQGPGVQVIASAIAVAILRNTRTASVQ